MNCPSIQPDLKAFCDGELPFFRRLVVRRHLADCAACREEMKLMEQTTADLRATEPAETLPPTLRARILENTVGALSPDNGRTGEEAASPEHGDAEPPFRRPALAWGIAGIVLIAGFLLTQIFGIGQRDSMNAPQYMAASKPAFAPMAVPAPTMHSQRSMPYSANPPSLNTNMEPAIPAERQVHKEATITVQVADPEEKSNEIEARAKEAGGFIASNTLNTGDNGLKSADLTVKVPVAQFETVLGQIAKIGNVQAKNVAGEDITEKASDAAQAEAVLEDETQRAQARLTQLGKKAGWADQQAIRDLRIQRAQARGRLVLLRKMAALATITVTLSQTPKPVAAASTGFFAGLTGTTHSATQSLLGSAGMVLSLLIWILAYAPIWIPIALAVRYGVRFFARRVVRE